MIAKTNSDAIELLTGGAQHWGSRREIRSSEGEVLSKGCLARAHRQMQENGRKHLIESRQLRKKEPAAVMIVEEVQEREDQMGRSIAHYWAPTDCFRADNLNAVSASILEMMEPAGECCIESKISLSRAFEQATMRGVREPSHASHSGRTQIKYPRHIYGKWRYAESVREDKFTKCCRLFDEAQEVTAKSSSHLKPLQTWESELHDKFLYGLIIPWATGHCQSNTARPESEVFVGE
ncbi:uncharacterized protein C8R40DRAFT_1068423 [Lentinula edodes]|uniref:uncharacterized protein n=1 Tax=Lentinula edodes TaxID=5353 RepID=UPI001E8D219C|nr:uncharacterized protein C8R40DRAFT_1068423 [Lentinula edodes]KAH7876628.1 hypothetical protein C8R40DRAFT_1068423 [Lentinula edodes]